MLLGGFLLGAISARTPLGFAVALVAGVALSFIAYFTLSCAAGRAGAWIRNELSLYSAHSDLGKFMRTNETFRAARRGISRPLH